MTPARLKELLALYRSGQLSQTEWEQLSAALDSDSLSEAWAEDMDASFDRLAEHMPLEQETDHIIWSAIRAHQAGEAAVPMPARRTVFIRRWAWTAAAAVLVVAGVYFWRNSSHEVSPATTTTSLIDQVEPGKDGAILVLADGRQVVLDSLGNGVIASQDGFNVVYNNGALSYHPAAPVSEGKIVYNRIITPRGRQFYLVLADGTKAWLNAASSLYFPVRFAKEKRHIEVTGEVYLEVNKETSRPFYVQVKDQEGAIRVLGTSFNINAYEDDPVISTTLLEGAVQVAAAAQPDSATFAHSEQVILKPGQQAQIARVGASAGSTKKVIPSSLIKVFSDVDTDKVMAWKNGVFNFDHASLQQVMNQLARWYDLDIEYQQGIPAMRFGGKMNRDLKLSEVLDFLEGAGVRFTMKEQGKLIVLPNR